VSVCFYLSILFEHIYTKPTCLKWSHFCDRNKIVTFPPTNLGLLYVTTIITYLLKFFYSCHSTVKVILQHFCLCILTRVFMLHMSLSIKDVFSVHVTSAFTNEITFWILLLQCRIIRSLLKQLCYAYTYFVRCTGLTIMSYISGIVICCLCVKSN
jgi:hypothetical protein